MASILHSSAMCILYRLGLIRYQQNIYTGINPPLNLIVKLRTIRIIPLLYNCPSALKRVK